MVEPHLGKLGLARGDFLLKMLDVFGFLLQTLLLPCRNVGTAGIAPGAANRGGGPARRRPCGRTCSCEDEGPDAGAADAAEGTSQDACRKRPRRKLVRQEGCASE